MNMLNVIMLENDNIILTESYNKNDFQIMNECVEKYDIAKKNKPLLFLERIPITEQLNVDERVKYYMKYYGINNVRGGSFEEVSNEQYDQLVQEFCDKDAIELLHNLKYFVHDHTIYTIDRSIIKDIEWLMDSIYMKYNMDKYNNNYLNTINMPLNLCFNDDGMNKYNKLIIALNAIYNKDIKCKWECLYSDYIKNPYSLFDRILFSSTEITQDDITITKTVCDYFEYLVYCIINKCDELEFDLHIDTHLQ